MPTAIAARPSFGNLLAGFALTDVRAFLLGASFVYAVDLAKAFALNSVEIATGGGYTHQAGITFGAAGALQVAKDAAHAEIHLGNDVASITSPSSYTATFRSVAFVDWRGTAASSPIISFVTFDADQVLTAAPLIVSPGPSSLALSPGHTLYPIARYRA